MAYIASITGGINSHHTRIVEDAILAMDNDPTLIIEIHIDSTGGDPDVANHIFNLLEPYRSRTTAIAIGKCMSSAVLIFLAADARIATATSNFMIHPTSWTFWGTYGFLRTYKSINDSDLTLTLSTVYTLQAQLNTAIKRLTEIEDYTDEIFLKRANLTECQFRNRRTISTDQYFTATESLQFGISTKII